MANQANLDHLAMVVFTGVVQNSEALDPKEDPYGFGRVTYQDCLEAVYQLWRKAHPRAALEHDKAEHDYVVACDSSAYKRG